MEASLYIVLPVLGALVFLSRMQKQGKQPPGPRGLPIVGNIFDIPKAREWLTYSSWSRKYDSPIVHLRLLNTDMYILHSREAVNDLLVKRSSIYSDRAQSTMLNLMGWQRLFALAPYGDDWKARTRIFQQHFNSSTTVKYRPTLLTAAHLLLSNIRKRQDAFLEHFRHLAAYSIMGVTYGIEVRAQDDRYLEVAERGTRCLARAIKAGGHAVDVLPFLRYLPAWAPGAQFKRDAIEWSKDVTAMLDVPFEFVEQNLNGGVQNTSAVGTVLRDIEQSEDQSGAKEVARDAFGTAYVGGANTAYGALTIFTLAMLKYPHVQVKGQEHIDHVVGRERLPDFSDREALPYITAIVQEVLRWIVISPLAVPHRLTVDDEYEGCHFRAGSLFVGNAWAILHDETRYPDPEAFMPERYLAPDGKLDENAPDPTEACFGYGRRMCPGRQFALEEIWIAVVSLLAAFSIEKAIDEFGAIIEPSGEDMTASGAVYHPAPFKAAFKPRHEKADALIRDAAAQASDDSAT